LRSLLIVATPYTHYKDLIMHAHTGTIRETFTIEMDEPEGEEINSLTPIPDNLCVAQGPLVCFPVLGV